MSSNLQGRYELPNGVVVDADVQGYIGVRCEIALPDLVWSEGESAFDVIGQAAVGSDLLMDFNYRVLGAGSTPNHVALWVEGSLAGLIEAGDAVLAPDKPLSKTAGESVNPYALLAEALVVLGDREAGYPKHELHVGDLKAWYERARGVVEAAGVVDAGDLRRSL